MLHVQQLEEVENKLLAVSELIGKQRDSNSSFVNDVETWLKELDAILQKNRLPISGHISVQIGSLLSAKRGIINPNIKITGRATRRKLLEATIIDILNQVVRAVEMTIQNDRLRIDEAERVALQLISIARAFGLLQNKSKAKKSIQLVQELISAMKSQEATVQGIVQLEGLLGKSDTIIVIGRVLNYS